MKFYSFEKKKGVERRKGNAGNLLVDEGDGGKGEVNRTLHLLKRGKKEKKGEKKKNR